MKSKKLIGIALLFFTTIQSCKKEKSAAPCNRNVAGLTGKYKLSALEYKMTATSASTDYLPLMDACEKDDIIELKADGSWIYTDAGTICTPSGIGNGSWTVLGNVITSDGVVSGTIESYDCKKLILSTINVILPGDRFTQTLIKQ